MLQRYCFFPISAIVVLYVERHCPGFCFGKPKAVQIPSNSVELKHVR